VIENFAAIVVNQTNMDALMLLTAADGLGVGDEKIWNAWTESLVWQLYRQTTRFFEDSEGFRRQRQVEREELQKEVAGRLPKDFELELGAHFASLPDRYFLTFQPEDIAAHVRMFRVFLEENWNTEDQALVPVIRWIPHPDEGHTELRVCTWDRRQLLARICGALTANELSILSADIFTRGDGLVVDTFRITNTRFQAVEEERDMQRVERLLKEALKTDAYDFSPLISKKVHRVPTWDRKLSFPTRFSISTEANPNYTVVDMVAPDRLGLLYDILSILGSAGFLVAAARITTEKGAAIDSFYITDLEGRKVTQPHLLDELQKALHRSADLTAAVSPA
jgi:[protein-PII] uridylyltransferase